MVMATSRRPPENTNSEGQRPQALSATTEEDRRPARPKIARAPSHKVAPKKAVAEETRHRAHERYFWRRQLRAAHCLNWITLIGAAVAFAGLVFVGASLLLTREAVRDGAKTANAASIQAQAAMDANRPWVKVTLDSGDLKWLPFGPVLKTGVMSPKVTITNVGHLPALNVKEIALGYIELDGRETLKQAQDRTCAEITAKTEQRYSYGKILFPGDTVDGSETGIGGRVGFGISPSQIGYKVDSSTEKKTFVLMVIGCVDYSFGPMSEHHQTFFAYNTIRRIHEMAAFYPFTYGDDVMADQFSFSPAMDGNYAN
jgi:hypothetical protein